MKTTFLGPRKRLCRTSENDMMNEQCLNWFQDATKSYMPLSGPLIQQQALKFAKNQNNDTFKASNRWLDSLLKRNKMVFRTMTVGRGDVYTTTVDDLKKNLPALCEGYRPEDIFNVDETGLFFREMTDRSFHTKGEVKNPSPWSLGRHRNQGAFYWCFIFKQIKR